MKLGVFLSNTKSRRGKLTADKRRRGPGTGVGMKDVTTATGTTVPEARSSSYWSPRTGSRRCAHREQHRQRAGRLHVRVRVRPLGRRRPAPRRAPRQYHQPTAQHGPGRHGVRSAPPRAVLRDVTHEQQARLEAAALAPDLRVCEDLTGANGGAEYDDPGGQREVRRGAVSGIADAEVSPAARPVLDAKKVLAATQRFTWACTDPGNFLVPDASREILDVALAAVRAQERGGYVRGRVHIRAFTAAAKARGMRSAVGTMRGASTGCCRARTRSSVSSRWRRVARFQSAS